MAALTYKKKVILAFMEKLGRSISAKSLQKYLFIFSRMQIEDRIYDFVPYKYGCFSFQANQDIVSLEKAGYISIQDEPNSDKLYTLLHDVRATSDLDSSDSNYLDEIIKRYGRLTQEELIAYTYRTWPFTAINSVIKERLLSKEELEKVEYQRSKYINDTPMLFTMGYEGCTLEKYIHRLITNDIRVLVDVRKNAFSRKYGFSRSILEKACTGVNIKYIHVPELGIESEKRKELTTQRDYDILFEDYERTTLKNNWKYLLNVRFILDKERRICLLCFEKDPKQCHRTRIAKALMNLSDCEYNLEELVL